MQSADGPGGILITVLARSRMARPMLRQTFNSTPPSSHEKIPCVLFWKIACVMPYVSVIIPAYNAAQFIADAYRSVVDQTIDDWEIIFVNDGSQDATLSTIRSLAANEPRVKVIASHRIPGLRAPETWRLRLPTVTGLQCWMQTIGTVEVGLRC